MSHIGPSNASSSRFRVSRNSKFPSFHISVHGNIKFDRTNVLFRSSPGSWEHCNQISPCALYLEVQVYEEILILETDDCLLYRDCKKYCSQLHKIRHKLQNLLYIFFVTCFQIVKDSQITKRRRIFPDLFTFTAVLERNITSILQIFSSNRFMDIIKHSRFRNL